MPATRRGFTLQLLLLIVLPLTAVLLLVAFGGLELHREAMRRMVGERDERATRAAAAALGEQLNYRAAAVRGLASAHGTPEQALAAADYVLPDFERGLALFDAEGRRLAASPDEGWWDQPAVLARIGAAEADPVFVQPFADPVTGLPVAIVLARSGERIAAGAFDPGALSREAISRIFGGAEGASAFVVAPDGQLLYQAGDSLHGGADHTDHIGVAAALRGESGTTYLQGQEEHVVAFSPVTPVRWALVIEEPWHAVADPLLRATELAPLVLVPVVAVAAVAFWFGARQIVQPLQALEQQATALGRGDYAAIESNVGGIGEIRNLQGEMQQMAHQLQAAEAGLRGYLDAMTSGQEEERRRLARELHDDTLQSLIALNQRLQLAQLSPGDAATAARLAEMGRMAQAAIDDLRRLTRDLRPSYLDDLGLTPALQMLTRDASQTLGIPVTLVVRGEEGRLEPPAELALYRIAQEALSNVARHAAASRVEVALSFATESVALTISDDGRGFTPPPRLESLSGQGHYGLVGIAERSQAIGARLAIDASPGRGTGLAVTLPRGAAAG